MKVDGQSRKAPWYRWCRRWFQTNLTEADVQDYDVDAWRRIWREHAVQGVIVNAGGIVAYYPADDPLQYRAPGIGDAGEGGRDLFGEIVAAAREEGLVVIARMDCNRAEAEALAARPDLFCRDREGQAIASQRRYFTCVHSAYYREIIPARLRDIIRRYRPDGFSDNSWRGRDRHFVCYCDNCRRQFEAHSGHGLPERADARDPHYEAWYQWSLEARTAIWRRFDEVCRAEGGEDCRWAGMVNADPSAAERSFLDLRRSPGRRSFCSAISRGGRRR